MIKLEAVKLDIPKTQDALKQLSVSLNVEELQSQQSDFELEVATDGFWNDIERAQERMKIKKQVENKLQAFYDLENSLKDIEVYIQMAEEEDDDALADEVIKSMEKLHLDIEKLTMTTLLTGEYDGGNAIVSIHPGTGGTDAQDWAEMLLRMYSRWADDKGYSVKVLDFQRDTEGGIKNVTALVSGENAYGLLKTEHGVHRLVRISPYNTAGKRQTSFASVDVMPELPEDIEVEIAPEDLRIDTYRASGAGGQYVNKTESAVRITHIPTNIVVTCQNERSQNANKEYAMRMLYSKLYTLAIEEKKDKISELKGNYGQISWGNQIRSYVFQPYTLVKDHRTNYENANVTAVVDGDLDGFINASLVALSKGEL